MAVFAFRVRELGFGGEPADLGLEQIPDREDGPRELCLAQQREEVGLILVGVEAFEQVEGAVGVLAATRVVSGGDGIIAVGQRPTQEDAELHFAVTDDVRVRGQAIPIAVDEVLDHGLAVVLDEVEDAEGQAQVLGHGSRIADVILPGAFAGEREALLVHPGPEIGRMDLVPLLLEQERRHGAVDAARERYEDPGHRVGS